MRVLLQLSYSLIKPRYTMVLALGLVIGVGFLLIIMALFQNYYAASEQVFRGIHPHVQIHKDGMSPGDFEAIRERLSGTTSEILDIRPALYLYLPVTLNHTDQIKAICVDGKIGDEACFDSERFQEGQTITTRYGYRTRQTLSDTLLCKGVEVIDGRALSEYETIINGDTDLNLLNALTDEKGRDTPLSFYLEEGLFNRAVFLEHFLIGMDGEERWHPLILRGSLALGTKKARYPLAVFSLKALQKISGQGDRFNTLEIAIEDPYKARALANTMREVLGEAFQVTTWIDEEKASFTFLQTVKVMIFAIVFSICIVAATSIVSTLTMTVMENRRKIAILKALGLTSGKIYGVFLINTLAIGVIGVVLGIALGFSGGSWLIDLLADGLANMGMSNPSLDWQAMDLFLVAAATLVLCFFSALIPARGAIQLETVDGLSA